MVYKKTLRHRGLWPAICALLLTLTGGIGTSPVSAADSAFELQDYRGKVVMLDFWASWCVPCRHSFPWMNRMQQQYAGDGLVIIGVNLDANASDAEAFLRDFPAEFTIVADAGGELARQYAVEAMPSSYVIDRNGRIVVTHLGFQARKTAEYETNIRKVLFANED
jgi:thiol-disulfide isomerase/thioredoxin